jgi:hypothetical protein
VGYQLESEVKYVCADIGTVKLDSVGVAPEAHFTSTKVTTADVTVTAYRTVFCGSEKSKPTDTA